MSNAGANRSGQAVVDRNHQQTVSIFRGPNQPDTDIDHKVKQLETLLRQVATEFSRVRLASSLAAEDNVIFDAIARLDLPISTFSLNTGRLHRETLDVAQALQTRYGKSTEWIQPVQANVEQWVASHGADAFYESSDLRKQCCNIRKVEPLNRALESTDAWITGQRQAQAATRQALPQRERDQARGIEKLNPLADWTEADVWTYVRQYEVPVNALHFQGFPSIGCEPCTRAITLGEDIRSGRWWWEDPTAKECGLHGANLKRV